MEFESRLVPILREGVDIIKMIFFKKLRARLVEEYPDRGPEYIGKMAGAVINELFGTTNSDPSFVAFAAENKTACTQVINNIATDFEEMRIPLTDSLRTAVLCDHQEGIDNSAVLARAKELGILLVERELPLPHSFLNLVRKLGASFGLLVPPVVH